MRRIFGRKKEAAPQVSLQETGDLMEKRADVLQAKIDKLDAELLKYKQQMGTARGAHLASIKERAMRVLRQKKMYEAQRDSVSNQAFNVQQVDFARQQISDAKLMVDAARQTKAALQQDLKTIKIDDVENLTDDLSELMYQANELSEELGRSYALPDSIDESELDAELEALQSEVLAEEMSGTDVPSYLSVPSVPTHAPGTAASNASASNERVGVRQ